MCSLYPHALGAPNPSNYQAPKGRLLPFLIIFFFLMGLVYSGYLFFHKRSLESEISRLETRIEDAQAQINDLQENQLQELIQAQILIDAVNEDALEWSKLIRKLEELTPVGIFFSNYSGSSSGLQIVGVADSTTSLANLISNMERSEDFAITFLPTVSRAITSDGKEVLSFTLEIYFK